MDKKKSGLAGVEILLWVVVATATAIAYVHANFVTYREVAPMASRIERIEGKLDAVLENK